MNNLSIRWNYFGRNQHAILKYDGAEFVSATRISRVAAELLVEAGMNSGS